MICLALCYFLWSEIIVIPLILPHRTNISSLVLESVYSLVLTLNHFKNINLLNKVTFYKTLFNLCHPKRVNIQNETMNFCHLCSYLVIQFLYHICCRRNGWSSKREWHSCWSGRSPCLWWIYGNSKIHWAGPTNQRWEKIHQTYIWLYTVK